MQRLYVASRPGTSMIFRVNERNKVTWASPKYPRARGTHVRLLRQTLRAKGWNFYEVA